MRRTAGQFEVVIDSPAVGLVTRIPEDQPDEKSASEASNVRFEEGVSKNAQGYGVVTPGTDLDSAVTFIYQADLAVPFQIRPARPAVVGTMRKLYSLLRLPLGYTP